MSISLPNLEAGHADPICKKKKVPTLTTNSGPVTQHRDAVVPQRVDQGASLLPHKHHLVTNIYLCLTTRERPEKDACAGKKHQ